ncbi:MAG: ribonuclease III [Planctomycetaceae bacterium]|nr:ribonuclease III [Planctomycetaceae bacterium]
MSDVTGASDELSVQQKLELCEALLHYRFLDRALLETCLTHASVAKTRLDSNERLEFLGDAILGAIVCERLFHRFPEATEGELTRMKSSLVSRNTCAAITKELGLDRCLLLGKGLSVHHEIPLSIMAGVIEALVAGVYFDGGMEACRRMVERMLSSRIEQNTPFDRARNFKSQLQQLSQKSFGETPIYQVLDEKGPDHSKCFQVSAVIGPQTFPSAWGNSKKEAEQRAASNALLEIQGKKPSA